jgi:hypothetical protein
MSHHHPACTVTTSSPIIVIITIDIHPLAGAARSSRHGPHRHSAGHHPLSSFEHRNPNEFWSGPSSCHCMQAFEDYEEEVEEAIPVPPAPVAPVPAAAAPAAAAADSPAGEESGETF